MNLELELKVSRKSTKCLESKWHRDKPAKQKQLGSLRQEEVDHFQFSCALAALLSGGFIFFNLLGRPGI